MFSRLFTTCFILIIAGCALAIPSSVVAETGPGRIPGNIKTYFKGDWGLQFVSYDMTTGKSSAVSDLGRINFRVNNATKLVEGDVTTSSSSLALRFDPIDGSETAVSVSAKPKESSGADQQNQASVVFDATGAVDEYSPVVNLDFVPIVFGNTSRGVLETANVKTLAGFVPELKHLKEGQVHYQFDIITPEHFAFTITAPAISKSFTVYGNRTIPATSLWGKYGTFTLLIALIALNYYINRKARQPYSSNDKPVQYKSESFGTPRAARAALSSLGNNNGSNKSKAKAA